MGALYMYFENAYDLFFMNQQGVYVWSVVLATCLTLMIHIRSLRTLKKKAIQHIMQYHRNPKKQIKGSPTLITPNDLN